MANTLYTRGKEALLDGSIIWTTSNIKVMLIDTTLYTVNLTTDQFVSDIPAGARLATSPILSNRTATNGVADADDVVIAGVTAANDIEGFVLYADTGLDSTSRLLGYFDSDSSAILPFTPNGGSVQITWSNGASKVFAV